MVSRITRRYSSCFKRQVVSELESGRFNSVQAASQHYGIKGAMTVRGWVRRLGKSHLLAKVVRVEAVDEGDRIAALRRQVERLQKALGQTQAESLLKDEYLKLACERLGEEVDSFKKKLDGKPCSDASTAKDSSR